MIKVTKNAVLCVCLAALTTACGADKKNIAATVNGTPIAKATFEGTVTNLIAQQQANANFADNEQTRLLLGRIALEQLIANEVLAQAAQKAHISATKEQVTQNVQALKQIFATDAQGKPLTDSQTNKKFQEKLKADGITLKQLKNNIKKELDAKLFVNDLSSKQKVELNEELLHKFYDGTMAVVSNNQTQLKALSKEDLALIVPFAAEVKKATVQRASVSAVFLATPKNITPEELAKKKELAKKIAQELRSKKITFVEAIQQYSDDKNALRTNGEQVVLAGVLPANLDKKVFESPLGQVEGPLTEKDGLYILRVNQKRAETTLSYDQLRNEMIKYLGALQIKQKVQQQVKDLVAKAKVEILLPQYKMTEAPADKK